MDTDVAGAQKLFQEQYQMCPPWHKPVCLYNLACCDSLLGNTDSALSFLARAIDAGYHDVAHMQKDSDLNNIRLTSAYKLLLSGIVEAPAPASEVTPQKLYNVACFCCLVGNTEAAISTLEKAVAAGFSRANQLANNPDLTALHAHPKWPEILTLVSKNKENRIQNCRDRKPWRARKHCNPPMGTEPAPQKPVESEEIPEIPVEPKQEIPEIPEIVAEVKQEIVEEKEVPKVESNPGPQDVMVAHLEVLREMGFVDGDRNLVALLQTKGDIEKAILHLLQ